MTLLIALMLALPLQKPAPQGPGAAEPTDTTLREQVVAYLGSIDTPITPAQWKALGPRGRTVLTELAQSHDVLPTRRAKAVDGLAALGAPAQVFHDLAASESEPLAVRLSAVRGLGKVVPASKLADRVRPLLEGARDSRIRAAAGEVLASHAPSACTMVRAQAAREKDEPRAQFVNALSACDTLR
jgi:hypothetical protein